MEKGGLFVCLRVVLSEVHGEAECYAEAVETQAAFSAAMYSSPSQLFVLSAGFGYSGPIVKSGRARRVMAKRQPVRVFAAILSSTAAEYEADRKVEVAVGFLLQFVIECKAQPVEQFHADARHETA